MSDKEYLSTIVKGIVSFPDDVSIVRTTDELGILLTVSINPEDMGKIIGKKGATADAIRLILRSFGFTARARINMKINEPETSFNNVI